MKKLKPIPKYTLLFFLLLLLGCVLIYNVSSSKIASNKNLVDSEKDMLIREIIKTIPKVDLEKIEYIDINALKDLNDTLSNTKSDNLSIDNNKGTKLNFVFIENKPLKEILSKTDKTNSYKNTNNKLVVFKGTQKEFAKYINEHDILRIYKNYNYTPTLDMSKEISNFDTYLRWYNYSGKNVRIAILDSGFDNSSRNLVYAQDYTNSSIEDTFGHGKYVQKIISSYSKDSEIYGFKVINNIGIGDSVSVASAIYRAVELNADIISLSLGSTNYDTLVEDAIDYAISEDTIVVAAAGNCREGCNGYNSVTFPAIMDNVIAVGSIDKNLNTSYFSSFFENDSLIKPDVVMVGENLIIDSQMFSGTSFSTPQVSAILALKKEQYNDMDQDSAFTFIQNGSIDLGDIGKDKDYGFGLLNVAQMFGIDPEFNKNMYKNIERNRSEEKLGFNLTSNIFDYMEYNVGDEIVLNFSFGNIDNISDNLSVKLINYNGSLQYKNDFILNNTYNFSYNWVPQSIWDFIYKINFISQNKTILSKKLSLKITDGNTSNFNNILLQKNIQNYSVTKSEIKNSPILINENMNFDKLRPIQYQNVSNKTYYNNSYEPNYIVYDTCEIATTSSNLDTLYYGEINPSQDVDWFRFDLPSGGNFKVSLQVPGGKDYELNVYKNCGEPVFAYSHNNAGIDELVTINVDSPQTYYVKIFGFGANDYSSSLEYVLKAQLELIEDGNNLCSEPTSLSLNNVYKEYIYPQDDVDWFKWDITQVGEFKVYLDVPEGDLDYDIDLYSSCGAKLDSRCTARGSGSDDECSYTVDSPGTIYAKVYGYGDSFSGSDGYYISGKVLNNAQCGNNICESGEGTSNCPSDCYTDFRITDIYSITPAIPSEGTPVTFKAKVKNYGTVLGIKYMEAAIAPSSWAGIAYPSSYVAYANIQDDSNPICGANDYYDYKLVTLGGGEEADVEFDLRAPSQTSIDHCNNLGSAWDNNFRVLAGFYSYKENGHGLDKNENPGYDAFYSEDFYVMSGALDKDGDGFTSDVDCNDDPNDPDSYNINPETKWYVDWDRDGYPNSLNYIEQCEVPFGSTAYVYEEQLSSPIEKDCDDWLYDLNNDCNIQDYCQNGLDGSSKKCSCDSSYDVINTGENVQCKNFYDDFGGTYLNYCIDFPNRYGFCATDKNALSTCYSAGDFKCSNNNVLMKCSYVDENTKPGQLAYLPYQDCSSDNFVCDSNLKQCVATLGFTLSVDYSYPSHRIFKQSGDKFVLKLGNKNSGSTILSYDENFIESSNCYTSMTFNSESKECFMSVKDNVSLGPTQISLGSTVLTINVIDNPTNVYVTDSVKLYQEYGSEADVQRVMSKLYEKASSDGSVVYDLALYNGGYEK